ncbi:TfuA-like protein [Rhizobium sp. BE258]|uniref:TfuA-like protein n=1 Tax=Rhizobium sp. BE258 TaxID=2817722 RepID=UPI000DD5D3DC|nr:TfuA-like protein [Rhizobium sp. BE258]MDR7142418.1 hypothetical protein [Rhizobium sp. BE258]
MGADIVVFLGPSLDAIEAQTHLDAVYEPPAGGGDIIRAVITHAPATIAIIDGVFAQAPGVRHQEILWAMSKGVHVYGAASIGALRAAELAGEGMIGHGMIYRWYRRFPLADDADVAVPMAPVEFGSRRLGEAMIDIRLTLKQAQREGVIGASLRRRLEAVARTLHFRNRSFSSFISAAESHLALTNEIMSLKNWLKTGAISRKKTDAISLLNYLKYRRRIGFETPIHCHFELTEAFAYDMESCNLLDNLLPKVQFL